MGLLRLLVATLKEVKRKQVTLILIIYQIEPNVAKILSTVISIKLMRYFTFGGIPHFQNLRCILYLGVPHHSD